MIAPELTSELLHCHLRCLIHGPWRKSLSTWKLASFFADEYVRRTRQTHTSEVTALHKPLCRYQLGLGIYNVQAAVEGMDGGKRSHLLYLCGQLLRLVLNSLPHQGRTHHWTQSTAISFPAELDGHVLGAMRSHHGVTHQSTRAMHPRVIRSRQIQVNGRPHPRPAGT